MNKGLVFMGMGFELVGLMFGGLYLGQAIDQHFHWPGYGLISLVIISLVSWMVHLIFLLKKFMQDEGSNEDSTRKPD
ncbi:MAG: AtpZ/AtpI family protein [Bdellovibrionales bacterium]